MKSRKRLAKAAVALALLALCGAALPWVAARGLKAERRHWKNTAIPQISNWAENPAWRTREITVLTNSNADSRVLADGWLTDKMILMENGEWLVYRSHCSKDKPHTIQDIFLAKGSDGKWYYSTFHFCVGMCALTMLQEKQPPDLKMFVHEYTLRPFDGQSDECLNETQAWPASWHQAKN